LLSSAHSYLGQEWVLLRPFLFPVDFGWRLAFGIGAGIGLVILVMRRHVPESPRWLITHGRSEEATQIVTQIEQQAMKHPDQLPPAELKLRLRVQSHTPWREIWKAIVHDNRRRSKLSFSLMVTQAFFYNAILFTYGLVLLRYYHVAAEKLGLYLLPLALANLLGPILLSRLFDTLGRRKMIAGTYMLSGLLLAIASWLFLTGLLNLAGQVV
jgi:MFS family permease